LASFVLEAVLEGTLDCVESVCERVLAEVTGIAHDKAYTPHQRYLPVSSLLSKDIATLPNSLIVASIRRLTTNAYFSSNFRIDRISRARHKIGA